MAKKFGKLLLFSAVIGSAVAAAYYLVQKKAGVHDIAEEDDYDDFSEDSDEKSQESRNYVSLNPEETTENAEEKPQEEAAPSEEAPENPEKESTFTPLTEQVAQASANAEESVEEFFDEEDSSDEEPPISEV